MGLIYQSQGFQIYCTPFQMLWLRAYLCGPWLTCSMADVMVPKNLMPVLCWWGLQPVFSFNNISLCILISSENCPKYHSLFIFHPLAGKIRKRCALLKRMQGNVCHVYIGCGMDDYYQKKWKEILMSLKRQKWLTQSLDIQTLLPCRE